MMDMKTVIGNSDTFKILVRSSNAKEGWHKTTRAMEVPAVGCVVEITTQRGNDVSESLVVVSGVVIVEDINKGNKLSADIDADVATFVFAAATEAVLSTATESATALYAWNRSVSEVSVSAGAEYSINGGDYVSTPGTIAYGDNVKVKITSSASLSTTVTATLTIGLDVATFDVTTVAI